MLKPLVTGGEPLYKLVRNKVFYIRNFMPPGSREKYTQALADFPDSKTCVQLWLFWRPHLQEVVDIAARRREYVAMREAAAQLTARVARKFAEALRNDYLPRQSSVQIKRVCQLRHNEIRRQLQPSGVLDLNDDWRFARQRQELIDYADTMPDNSAVFHVRYVQA